jgi:hypothetical protein
LRWRESAGCDTSKRFDMLRYGTRRTRLESMVSLAG